MKRLFILQIKLLFRKFQRKSQNSLQRIESVCRLFFPRGYNSIGIIVGIVLNGNFYVSLDIKSSDNNRISFIVNTLDFLTIVTNNIN